MSKISKHKILTAIILILVGIFFTLFLKNIDYSVISSLRPAALPLTLSGLFSLAFRYFGVWIWRSILKDLGTGQAIDFQIASLIYAKAWMARYIPGTIAWVSGKVIFAKNLGISRSRLTAATLTEIGAQVAAVSAMSILLISLDSRLDTLVSGPLKLLPIMIVLMLLLCLVPRNFNRLIGFAYQVIFRKPASSELSINAKAAGRAFLLYNFGAFLSGAVYYFLATSISADVTPNDLLYIVGASNLAGVIGMLTPLVPAGLGTRDISMLVLLSAIMPKEIALAITVASRLWTAIIDVIFFSLAQIMALGKNIPRQTL